MVRHGQSQNNKARKHSGWSHCPLIQNVAAFSHAFLIVTVAENIAEENPPFLQLPTNGSESVFDYTDGKWKIERWNVTGKP